MNQRSKIVKHCFRTIAALAISLMGTALVPTLKADDWDKKTNITIDQSIDVQGTVLPPGSYVIKVGPSADRHTVQIFNADESHLMVTVLAIPAYRLADTNDSQFKFHEVAEGQPPALRAWFHPGDNLGFEFRAIRGGVAAQAGQRTNAKTSNAGGN
jgi:hypothetical protein